MSSGTMGRRSALALAVVSALLCQVGGPGGAAARWREGSWTS